MPEMAIYTIICMIYVMSRLPKVEQNFHSFIHNKEAVADTNSREQVIFYQVIRVDR